jgi:hypothetical protein
MLFDAIAARDLAARASLLREMAGKTIGAVAAQSAVAAAASAARANVVRRAAYRRASPFVLGFVASLTLPLTGRVAAKAVDTLQAVDALRVAGALAGFQPGHAVLSVTKIAADVALVV